MYLISWDSNKNSLYFSIDIIEHVAHFIILKTIGAIPSKLKMITVFLGLNVTSILYLRTI